MQSLINVLEVEDHTKKDGKVVFNLPVMEAVGQNFSEFKKRFDILIETYEINGIEAVKP